MTAIESPTTTASSAATAPSAVVAAAGSTAGPLPGRRTALVVATIVTALIGATLALWAVWGPAVFYEVILAGIAACF